MAATRTPESMRLQDFSDRELIAIVADNLNEDGWAKRRDIAAQIFPFVNGSSPIASDPDRVDHVLRCVSVRLAWMRRFGVIDKRVRDPKDDTPVESFEDSQWSLTVHGEAFLRGELNQLQQRVLADMSEAEMLQLTSVLATRYNSATPVGATLIRREWNYATHPTRKTG